MHRNALVSRIARIAARATLVAALSIGAGATLLAAQKTPPRRRSPWPALPTDSARATGAPASFSLEQILSYPYTEELTASPTQSRLAWVFVRSGVRNVWAASGPDFTARQITNYHDDDGQELTNL